MEKIKILLIDDEKIFGRAMKLSLENTDEYEVMVETKGKEAINVIWSFKPDLILLDIIMPDMEGDEVASLIKSDERLKHIPIIFLSAIVRRDEVTSHKGFIGGQTFVAKPVNMEILIKSIEKEIKKGQN